MFATVRLNTSTKLATLLLRIRVFVAMLLTFIVLNRTIDHVRVVNVIINILKLNIVTLGLNNSVPLVNFVYVLVTTVN